MGPAAVSAFRSAGYAPPPGGGETILQVIENKEINFGELDRLARTAVHFLDNVIEINHYPLRQIEEASRASRKIGLGIWEKIHGRWPVNHRIPPQQEFRNGFEVFVQRLPHQNDRLNQRLQSDPEHIFDNC